MKVEVMRQVVPSATDAVYAGFSFAVNYAFVSHSRCVHPIEAYAGTGVDLVRAGQEINEFLVPPAMSPLVWKEGLEIAAISPDFSVFSRRASSIP